MNAKSNITKAREAVNTVKVGGNIEIKEAEQSATAIRVNQAGKKGTNDITVAGDVIVEGNEGAYAGIEIRGSDEGQTNISVGGKVQVASEKGNLNGVAALIYNGETNITINGGIAVEGKPQLADETEDEYFDEYVTGMTLYGWSGRGKVNVTVLDDVSATALINSDHATAVSIYNNGGASGKYSGKLSDMDISITGDVDSSGTGIFVGSGNTEREFLDGEAEVKETEYIMTQKTVNEDGEVEETRIYYNEDGKYYYNENGAMWKETTYEAGASNVKVEGDVKGGNIGINIDSGDNASILVDGTVSGHNSSILVNNEIIDDNMTLTVWEILPDDEGNYTERVIGQDKDGNDITVSDEQLLQQIQYIIRIEQTQVNYINTMGTTDYEGYKVANEGDTVTLKLNIPAGYIVDGAYGDVDQQIQLLKDDNGDYYLIVPRGGGVLLSLKMHRAAARTVKLTFNPNGGTVGGSSAPYTITTYLNKEITLPTPDEREGYDFLGWFGADYGTDDERWSEPDENSSAIQKGGATFKAEGDMTFTAVWKKK